MVYCTKCGTPVADADRFCPNCGMKQHGSGVHPAAPYTPAAPPPATSSIRPNVAAMLCYIPVVGWIAAIVFLTLDPHRSNPYVRFHAFQGLYLAVISWLAHVFWFPFGPAAHVPFPFHWFGIRSLIHLLVFVAQIVGIIKTVKNEPYHVPLVGDLAQKSVA